MAGTLTITDQEHRTFRKLLLDWLSDASGDVNGTLRVPRSRPTITERQAHEYYAMRERFSSDAAPEMEQWNAEQPYGRRKPTTKGPQ